MKARSSSKTGSRSTSVGGLVAVGVACLGIALVALGIWAFGFERGSVEPLDDTQGHSAAAGDGQHGTTSLPATGPRDGTGGGGTDAARGVDPRDPLGANGASPALLRCVDAETKAPLAGVRLYDQKTDTDVAVSDRDGLVRIPRDAEISPFLLAWGDGVLARALPAELRAALQAQAGEAAAPETLAVNADRYTIPCRVVVRSKEAQPPSLRAALTIEALEARAVTDALPLDRIGAGAAVPAATRLAWDVHVRNVFGLPNEVVHYHLGPRAMPWRGSLDGLTLRFAQRGRYLVRAVEIDGAGLVASALVDVDPRAEGEVVLDFQQGQVVAVTVKGDGDRAIPRALVRLYNLTHPRHAPYQDETDDAGRARFTGLHAGDRFEVVVEARLHEAKKQTLQAGGEARFRLEALPREQHVVTVVEVKSNAPIHGAGLWLDSADGREADFRCDAAGTTRIEVHGDADHVLVVRADGFMQWRELTSSKLGGGVPRFVRLLPSSRARQLELGLVGMVEGQVLRADGQPWKGASVRLVAARDASGQLLPDSIGDDGFAEVKDDAATKRPVLEGQRLEGTLDAITDSEGRFELWCVQRGRARVLVLEKDAPSREVFVRLGAKVRADLR